MIRAAFSMGLREAVHPFELLKAPAFPSWSLLSSPSESRSYHLLSSPTSASRTTFACWPPVLSLGPSSQGHLLLLIRTCMAESTITWIMQDNSPHFKVLSHEWGRSLVSRVFAYHAQSLPKTPALRGRGSASSRPA